MERRMASCEFLSPTQLTVTLFENYTNVITSALVWYEYFLTLSQEIEVVWGGKHSLYAALILLVRYNILCNATMVLLICMHVTTNAAIFSLLKTILDVSSILAYFFVAAFTSLRISAVWEKDRRLLFTIFSMAIAPAITSTICLILPRTASVVIPKFGAPSVTCELGLTMDPDAHVQLVLASQIPNLVSNTLVLILTWIKTVGNYRMKQRLHLCTSLGLTGLFLRNGTVYFLVLFVMDVSQLSVARSFCLSQITYVLSSILVSRFLLNLRQSYAQSTTQETSTSTTSMICFAGSGGNLAEYLVLPGDIEEDSERDDIAFSEVPNERELCSDHVGV